MNANCLGRAIAPLASSIALLLVPAAHAVDRVRANNNSSALNTTGAWTAAVVPGAADVMVWDNTFTLPVAAGSLPDLGGDLSVLGIRVANVGGTLNAATTQVGFKNATSANTVTIGASGIDLSAATQAIQLQSKITIGASQAWTIANANTNGNPLGFNNGEDLGFQALAAGAAFNFGGNTVTTSGAGQVTITSGYTLSNGTLTVGNNLFVIQGGGNRLTTIDSTLTMNVNAGAALRLQSNSGALTSGAAINLNGGNLIVFVNNGSNAVTMNGNLNVLAPSTITVSSPANGPAILSGNLTGSAALTLNNTTADAQRVLRLAGNNSGYSGAITLGGTAGRATRLTNAAAGSAAAAWTVNTGHTLQVDGVSVDLGTLNGAGTVTNFHMTNPAAISVGAGNFSGSITNGAAPIALTKVGPGTLTLSGFSGYTGATNVNGGTLLVSPGGISSTAVSVANNATYGVQSATSGFLDTIVTAADGGNVLVRQQAVGVDITIPAVTVGTSTGGFVTLDTGVFGNPSTALLVATTFSAAAGTKVRILGSNLTSGTFPAIAYTGAIGGDGFSGLSLELPFRVTGGLVNNPSSVDVNITGTAKPTWRGNINANWDIDSVGNGSTGTANWAAVSGPNTYVEAPVGVDSVVFDDTATGVTTVNLTTAVSPNGVTVNNTNKSYTFSGSGKISGGSSLSKSGSGTLTVANTSTNDFGGGTFITDGTVRIGDGLTAGAGTLGTAAIDVTSPGLLELNRPDDFTLANAVTGTGGFKKSNVNTATISSAANFAGAIDLAGGTLRYTGGGNLGGPITGAGALTTAGGTLMLSGVDANTNTGLTTVSSGTLQLNKTGVNAIGGDLLITGTGGLALSQPEQIADTATITYHKTGANQGTIIIGNAGTEVFSTLNVLDGNDTGTQVQAHSGFVATGNVNLAAGAVFAIASGHIASAGGVTMTGAPFLRIAGNSNPSTLNVGSAGITAAGGTIQVGQGTGAFDAVLNLDGNYTGTGNVVFTDGGFTGAQKREINLGAAIRTFDIAAATTTTIAPDIAGDGGITKTGGGTLQLTAASNSTYLGATTVSGGTLLTTTSQTGGGDFNIGTGATLGITQTFAGATLPATNLDTDAGSTLQLATGAFGNPTLPLVSATGAFTVDGATTIRLTGIALSSATGIPLISYGSIGGASGFSALSIDLPTRMSGTLVNNTIDQRVDLDLVAEQAKWNGNISGNWDIDPNGTQATGTQNWRTTISNTPTTYFQGPPVDTDTANFDDTATGTTTVNLTTLLTPSATNVANTAKTYTFTGPGKLTGNTSLNKTGTGTLILANSTAYDHTGGTFINDGVLQVGDGVTPGVGLLPTTSLTNNAMIVLNRPDDFAISTVINGSGAITKNGANVATLSGAIASGGTIQVNAGTLAFGAAANLTGTVANGGTLNFGGAANLSGPVTNTGTINAAGGGNISGLITGSGTLNATAGTLDLTGIDPNDYTGLTTVSGGALRLNKPGVTAVAGDITISGAGVLNLMAAEQIADTATINFIGSSTNSIQALAGNTETVANVILNSSVGGAAGGQIIMGVAGSNFVITGTGTATSGVLGVASGGTATVNAVVINSSAAILRIAGNSAGSTLNIGAGGITASAGEIQVKFNTNDQDAILNLGGNFTATGNIAITDANYNGASQHIINLVGGPRTFDIAASTTTTVAPDIGDGDLVKAGDGTLALNGKLGTTGAFTLTAGDGTTTINESQTIAALNIGDGATVILNEDLTPAPALAGGDDMLVDIGLGELGVGAASSFGDPSQVSAVPEPGAIGLLALGSLALLGRRRRR